MAVLPAAISIVEITALANFSVILGRQDFSMRTANSSIIITKASNSALDTLRIEALFFLLATLMACNSETFAQTLPRHTDVQITQLEQQAESDLHNQQPALAITEYQKILAFEPMNANAHSNLGLAYYMHGDFAPAAVQFSIALRGKPELWNIAALCGLSEAKIGQNKNAVTHLDQAFRHVEDPSLRVTAGKILFSLLFEEGDFDRAVEVVGQLQQLEPKNPDVLYAANQVYTLLSSRTFLAMAQLNPDSARMFQMRGDRMAQMGNTEGAIATYRLAIERDPHLSGAHFALAEALSASRTESERAEAENEYLKARADNPLDEKTECRLGDIAMQRSDLADAAQHYKRALELEPDDPDANEGLGMELLTSDEVQDAQDARRYLRRAIQLDPTNVAAYYHLSQASRKTGDLESANQEMAEFLKLKAQREALKQSFHDLPLQVARQAAEGQTSQPSSIAVPHQTESVHEKPKP